MTIPAHDPQRFAANAPICITCSRAAGSLGTCPSDRKPIHLHSDAGWCPFDKLPAVGPKPDGWHDLPEGTPTPRPSLLASAVHGAIGIARALTGSGGASDTLVADRSAICAGCEFATITLGILERCQKCGCATAAKVRNADEHCPIGRW